MKGILVSAFALLMSLPLTLRAQNQISTVRTIGLALPGILYRYNGSPSNVLSSLNDSGTNPFELKDAHAALREWDIHNRLDLLRRLNHLLDGGSNQHYLYIRQIYQEYGAGFQAIPDNYQNDINSLYLIDSPQLRAIIRDIWSIYHDLNYNDIRRLVFLWKMEDWFEIQPESIQSWDQARIVALVRWGYDVGYLSEQEAWPYIDRAGTWVIEHFANWNRFVENYIYGRLFEYAGVSEASQIFRDSALIWWELIAPATDGRAAGAWSNLHLQAYNEPQESFYLQLYRDLFYFQQAIRSGNTAGVQNILDQSNTIISPELARSQPSIEIAGRKVLQQPLDQPSARGMYPVILAAIYSEAVMNILLSRGFRYQVTDRKGRTALHWAAWNADVSAISLALQLGLNPSQPDNEGKTPIHFAARHNTSLALYRLLQDPRSAELQPDSEGYTPLHEACYNEKDNNTFGILLQERYNQLAIDARAGALRQTPLMIAASRGSAEQIVSLLQRGADPNARDINGWTPLHYASQSGIPSAIRLLLSEGSKINERSKQRETPLLVAVREADSKVVALLLQGGANVSYADLQLKRPVHWAGLNPDINVLQLLLQHGAEPNALGPNAQTPMHFAAELGDPTHLQILMDAGAPIDSNSRFGFTPLMIAVSNRNYEAANFLVNNGANLNHNINEKTALPQDTGKLNPVRQNPTPETAQPILAASSVPQPELPSLEELEQVQPSRTINPEVENVVIDYFGWSPITLAARQGDYQIVWSLVEAGADFQTSNVRGWYPLHLAAAVGTTEVLSYLISRGADITQENTSGMGPLELAATDVQNGAEKLRVLLRAGADLRHLDANGWSAMTYAALLGNREFVRQLLNQQVDPNDPKVFFPPLVAAAYSGERDIIFLLLQRGADPNLRYQDQGTTALHYAVALNRPELWGNVSARSIPAQLLQAGSLVNIADNKGNTPLFWAARWGNANLVKMLLDKQANTFEENRQKLTPFYYALENRYGPARYLIDTFPLAKIHQTDSTGMPPLIRAARFGSHRVVALLLAVGAKVKVTDKNGYNALHYALFAADPENISTLIRGGLNVRQKTVVQVDGKPRKLDLLVYTVRENAPLENISALLNWLKPADIDGLERKKALHYAVEQKKYALVELLLRQGANPNIAGADNDTPLIMAIKTQDLKMLRLLLEFGANVSKPGSKFQTPFQVATGLGNSEIVDLLRSYGSKGDYGFRPGNSSHTLDMPGISPPNNPAGEESNRTTEEIPENIAPPPPAQNPALPSALPPRGN
ncbi:MAG: ankyrin repeat domain-containing protein [Spirochaetota bacterium]